MIPLWVFLLVWLAFMGIFGLMSFISIIQMLRYGIRTSGTYAATFAFVITSVVVLGSTGIFFLTTDWSQPVGVFEGWSTSPIFNPSP